jgi:hypothetical protein
VIEKVSNPTLLCFTKHRSTYVKVEIIQVQTKVTGYTPSYYSVLTNDLRIWRSIEGVMGL